MVGRAMLDESLLISLGGCLAGILMTAVLGVVIGTLAAIIPARRAAHLDPLRALTYE